MIDETYCSLIPKPPYRLPGWSNDCGDGWSIDPGDRQGPPRLQWISCRLVAVVVNPLARVRGSECPRGEVATPISFRATSAGRGPPVEGVRLDYDRPSTWLTIRVSPGVHGAGGSLSRREPTPGRRRTGRHATACRPTIGPVRLGRDPAHALENSALLLDKPIPIALGSLLCLVTGRVVRQIAVRTCGLEPPPLRGMGTVRPQGRCRIRGTCDFGWTKGGAPIVPPGLFTSLSAGHSHNCAIKEADGSLTCWGWNDAGQATAPAGTFVVVALGWRHSCGLRESGEIECWGEIEPRCPAASSRPWRPVRMAADAASSGPRRGPLTTPASRAASSSAGGITCPGRMARRTRCSLRSRSASSTPAESGPTARSRVGAAILTAKPLYPTASLSPSASETSTAAA